MQCPIIEPHGEEEEERSLSFRFRSLMEQQHHQAAAAGLEDSLASSRGVILSQKVGHGKPRFGSTFLASRTSATGAAEFWSARTGY